MPSKTRRRLLALALVAGLMCLTLAFIWSNWPTPLPPLPDPNGYDDFLRAAHAVSDEGGILGGAPPFDRDRLRDVLAQNAEALRLLRLGLTHQCSVPSDWALTNVGKLDELASLKHLAWLLVAEGRLRELEGQPGQAALVYADLIDFGNELSRGGVLIDHLVGMACAAIGYRPVAELVPKLEGKDARPVIARLEEVERGRVTWGEVLSSERRYTRQQFVRRFPNPVAWAVSWWQGRDVIRRAQGKHLTIVAQERLLLTELALRCYQSERAQVPALLEELVPGYLARVPQDPLSGKPMVYRPQGTNWLLYSVGVDRVDDGGKPAGRALETTGDILFDSQR
jgi:hypothetical protein